MPTLPAAGKLKVFISYARSDASAFADDLFEGLTVAGFAPRLDRHDIAKAEDWEVRLGRLILEADTIVFIITPAAVKSLRCEWEVDRAVAQAKRLVPVVWLDVPDAEVPEALRRNNYTSFSKGRSYPKALGELATALRVDVEWIREHTRLGELAERWARNRGADLLLRGDELEGARDWARRRTTDAPAITETQRAYLNASGDAEAARHDRDRSQVEEVRRAQAETAASQKRAARRLQIGALLTTCLLVIVGWQAIGVMRRETIVFTSLAATALGEEQHDRAMRYALQAYPAPGDLHLGATNSELEGLLAGAAQMSALRLVFIGHRGAIFTARLSPDGRRVVTASTDQTVRLWDATTGAQIAEMKHDRQVWTASFSPDGSTIISASDDKTARVWDAATGAPVAVLGEHADTVWVAVFSPDGTMIATGSADGMVRLWSTATWREIQRFRHKGSIWSIAFSPDSQSIVVAPATADMGLHRVDGSRRVLLEGHRDAVHDVSFSQDGERVLSASKDFTARVWSVRDGTLIRELKGHRGFVLSARFNSDGSRIVSTSEGEITIWDGTDYREVAQLRGHSTGGGVWLAAFDRGGSRIFSVSSDQTARIWKLEDIDRLQDRWRPDLVLKGHDNWLRHAEFSPDGRLLLTASGDGTARLWDLKARHKMMETRHADLAWSGAFSPDGRRAVSSSQDGTAIIWDVERGTAVATLRDHAGPVHAAIFDRTGERVITAGQDGHVGIWSAGTGGRIAWHKAHEGEIHAIAISQKSERLATAAADKAVKVWDLGSIRSEAAQPLHTALHDGAAHAVSFSPDGTMFATGSADKAVRIFDAVNGRLLHTMTGHSGVIKAVAFNRDGDMLASGAIDQSARLWNANTGAARGVLKGHEGGITVAAFSPDGKRLLTASADHTARIWDVATTKPLHLPLRHYGEVNAAEWTPDGRRVLTAADDWVGRIWDAGSSIEIATLRGHTGGINSAAFNSDATRVITSGGDGDRSVHIWDVTWATKIVGADLRARVCTERLVGARAFTTEERANPILRNIRQLDPCERRWWR